MEKTQIVQCFQELLETVFVELFQHLNCTIKRIVDPADELDDVPIACIDAGSDDIEIMLLLQAPMSVLALTYPSSQIITEVDEEKLEDWISELTNQLIGRLKNKLIQHECRLNMGLPRTFFGMDADEILPSDTDYIVLFFDVDNEIIECKLALDFINEEMNFKINADDDDSGVSEGELEFF